MFTRAGKATLVSLTLALVPVSGCTSSESRPMASTHRAAPVTPIDATGPLPGNWHAAWTRTFAIGPNRGFLKDVALVGGVLLVGSSHGVEALNARTGATLWRSTSFASAQVTGFAVSGDHVAVSTGDARWFGVHIPTGKLTWRSESPSGRFVHYSDHLQALATSTTIPVVSLDASTIRGFDGRTGRVRWSIGKNRLYGCALNTSQVTVSTNDETRRYVSGKTLVLPAFCGRDDAVIGVDAESGRALWRRKTTRLDDHVPTSWPDRFIGIGENGDMLFEHGRTGDSLKLIVQDSSGRTKAELSGAEAKTVWGPLSPLTTSAGGVAFPFLRDGRSYFATLAPNSERISVANFTKGVRAAAFDGTRVYSVLDGGNVEVAAPEGSSSTQVRPAPRGSVFWAATGNDSLFLAASDSPYEDRVTITSVRK